MRKHRSHELEVHIGLRLVRSNGTSVPVAATLHYAGYDPFAVRIVFHAHQAPLHATADLRSRNGSDRVAAAVSKQARGTTSGDVSWSFSRDLLANGLKEPTGYGDVRMWPWGSGDGQTVALALSSPDGFALFEAPRAVIDRFLVRSYSCVPLGAEEKYLDIDSSVASLLSEQDVDPR